jgi:hypothetical protein
VRKAAEVSPYGWLVCPRCGENYLHQEGTSIFHREEDSYWTTVITQEGDKVTATPFPNSDTCNPSTRRHGLIIKFRCEHCENEPLQLAISQHKGVTLVEWVGE